MIDISRLGLGCMGMHMGNKDRAVDTVHAALDMGIKLFNTGEFYCGGASEMVLGEALKGVPRDKYFVSVKFGMLPKPEGGLYGIDVNPWHVKARLTYSLHHLGLDISTCTSPPVWTNQCHWKICWALCANCRKQAISGISV